MESFVESPIVIAEQDTLSKRQQALVKDSVRKLQQARYQLGSSH